MTPPRSIVVLDYGQPARWRRLIRWAIVALLLVALALAGLFAIRSLSLWLARRDGYAKVTAWYQQARTCAIAPGTLLYSESPADFGPAVSRATNAGGSPRAFVLFDQQQPLLRSIGYHGDGVPLAYASGVLYVHEHPKWAESGPPRPNLFCISYRGLDAQSRPTFFSTAYELADPAGKIRFPFIGSITSVPSPLTRSIANLCIFAGAPNPTDATRFALPFTCDGGAGQFEFQTNVDATDGGDLAPTVTIAWDNPATATTRPGAADVLRR